MIDPVAAAGALGKTRLAGTVGWVSRLAEAQSSILGAAAGGPLAAFQKALFAPAVLALIEAEELEDFFELPVPAEIIHG